MDQKTADYFTGIITHAQAIFEQVEYSTDATPERAILRLEAKYGLHRVFITELLGEGMRKYRYYVLRGDWVEAGFDNSPDPRAIRLKYGHIGPEHRGENVPSLHQDDKTRLSLTAEMTFEAFVDWLEANVQPTNVKDEI